MSDMNQSKSYMTPPVPGQEYCFYRSGAILAHLPSRRRTRYNPRAGALYGFALAGLFYSDYYLNISLLPRSGDFLLLPEAT